MISLFSKDYKKWELRALLELIEDFQCVFPDSHHHCNECELRHVCGDLNRLGKHVETLLEKSK